MHNLCKRALVHNGILHQYGEKNTILSDSAFFAKLLSGLMTDRSIKRALQAHETGNKFVVLSPDSIIRIGDFTKYKKCFYSNTSYIKREIVINQYTPLTVINNSEYENFWQKYYNDKSSEDYKDIEEYWQNKREKTIQLKVINEKAPDKFRNYLDNGMVKL